MTKRSLDKHEVRAAVARMTEVAQAIGATTERMLDKGWTADATKVRDELPALEARLVSALHELQARVDASIEEREQRDADEMERQDERLAQWERGRTPGGSSPD